MLHDKLIGKHLPCLTTSVCQSGRRLCSFSLFLWAGGRVTAVHLIVLNSCTTLPTHNETEPEQPNGVISLISVDGMGFFLSNTGLVRQVL